MKSVVIVCVFALQLISNTSFGQLKAYLDTKQFYTDQIGNYVEVYLQFVARSVKFEGKSGGLQGKIAVRIQVSHKDSVHFSDVYILESPLMKDSIVEDFYDVIRFAIPSGKNNLKIELTDVLNPNSKAITTESEIMTKNLNNQISFSDIEVAEFAKKTEESSNFTKSGYYILPRLSNFFPNQLSTLPVYLEIYNSALLSDSQFVLKQEIIQEGSLNGLIEFETFSKHKIAPVVPLIRGIDITNLGTGKYELIYSILDRSKKERARQSYSFERSNDIELNVSMDNIVLDPAFQQSISEDSVAFYLESLLPISRQAEILNIISTLKLKDIAQGRKHIQAYWIKTNATKPYDAWMSYKQQVQYVQRIYSNNFQDGYETDRGRVYLKYGSPTTVVQKETSPSEYPYEIWQYNKIGMFSNKRFIFYNPDLVNNTYRLLHSDMIGETKNLGWQAILSKRNTVNGSVDNPNQFNQQHFGGNSNDLFRQY